MGGRAGVGALGRGNRRPRVTDYVSEGEDPGQADPSRARGRLARRRRELVHDLPPHHPAAAQARHRRRRALLFVAFTRELSASILLYSPKLEVLSVVIYDMYQEGGFRALSALTMLQIVIAMAALALARWLAGADGSEEAQALR
jgi:hypothetical protein